MGNQRATGIVPTLSTSDSRACTAFALQVQGYNSTHLGNKPPSVLVIGSEQHIAASQILRRPGQGSGSAAGLQQGAGWRNMSRWEGCSACGCTGWQLRHPPHAGCPGCAGRPCQQQSRGQWSRWRPCLASHAQWTALFSATPCPRHPAGGARGAGCACGSSPDRGQP